nr:EOG090X0KVN [Polyphemus pediculus]
MAACVGEFQPVRDDNTGDLFLPASRRPDGTWRKPRRVKEGYVPQEEVPVYESKGKQWAKSQPAFPIAAKPANKKKKNSEKKKAEVKQVAKTLAAFTIEEPVFGTTATKPSSKVEKAASVGAEVKAKPTTASAEPAKRLKNLRKKLRDIEALEAKVKSGELKNPDKDQLEKIKRKKDTVKEIKELEKVVT